MEETLAYSITSSIGVIITTIAAFLKFKKRENIAVVFIVLGTIVSLLGIVFQYNKSEKEKKVAQEATLETKRYRDTANKYRSKFISRQDELINTQKENVRLSNELYNNVTGNHNYPLLVITGFKTRAFRGMFSDNTVEFYLVKFHLVNASSYPLNSIKVDFTDLYGYNIGQYVTITKNSISLVPDPRFDINHPFSEQSISFGTLAPNSIDRDFYITYVPMWHKSQYNVNITWIGGTIEYHIELNNVNKETLAISYEQVYTMSNINLNKKSLQNILKSKFPNEEISVKSVINRYGK